MVRVVSCRFLRLSCGEDDHPLFRRYYARSNRERGVKLLRCFPHCCPEHVQRCYCGTSIHVQVAFATSLPAATERGLVVCARFEPSRVVPLWPPNIADAPAVEDEDDSMQEHERKLQPGEVVSLPESVVHPTSRQANQSIWIRADREGECKQTTKDATLYVLNNHRFPKWLYTYDSSVTRTQREMTHHLVVYVFQLAGYRSQPGEIEAAVLARQESPGFSLMSYRRSGNSARDAGCDLPALPAAVAAFTSTSDDVEVDSSGQSTSPATNSSDFETKIGAMPAHPSALTNTAAPQPVTADGIDSDSGFWVYEARVHQSGLAEKAKHLSILWRFLSCVTLSGTGVTSDILSAQIRSHWLRAAGALQSSSGNRSPQLEGVMSSFLLSLCRSTQVFSSGQPASRDQVAVQAAAHLLLRALSSRAVQFAWQSAFVLEAGGMDKRQVRERFITLVSDLYDILDDLVQLGSPDVAAAFPGGHISIPALVDEVVSLIYSQRQFTGLRSEISWLLRGQGASHMHAGTIEHLFGAFTAQMQDIVFAAASGHDRLSQWTSSANASWSPWSRRWLLEPGSIQVTRTPQDHKLSVEPSLLGFSRWVYEFACLEVATRENESRLCVRSVIPMINGTVATELLLDGRLRAFRSTPSGISAMLSTPGGWSVGDYAGSFSGQTNTLAIDFYALRGSTIDADSDGRSGQLEDDTTVRRVNMTFALEERSKVGVLPASVDPRDRFIFFRGVVAQATYAVAHPESSSWDPQPKLADMATAGRSVVLRELQWTPELEVQGGYVAVPI